jgi:hypothetical protein
MLDEDVRIHLYWYALIARQTRSDRCNWPKASGDDRRGTQAAPSQRGVSR